ncbi:hypothetical protein TI39_contig4148g00001 [Zymoseptoria brevis]|uniref:Uncharacterized protein n=1 Tax=Zymoseptoria brevis TaxID=1047168 RepID=A0A0F4GC96_9PEZI|nr:hypothetical protein TI39_contig4148g00001 [Zymoseptoria brevis]
MTTLSTSQPRSYVFVAEFIVYSDCGSSFTTIANPFDASLPDLHVSVRSWSLTFGYCGNFFGVLDGTFDYLPRIRALRDCIRQARSMGQISLTDSKIVSETKAIECALQSWTSPFLPSSSRDLVACLYRHCMLIYLYRTSYASRTSLLFTTMVDQGLQYFGSVPYEMLPVMLLPIFILGCAAWEPAQRRDILAGLAKVQSWSRLKNVDHTRELLKEFWVKMDIGDEGVSWDWEAIAAGRNTLMV